MSEVLETALSGHKCITCGRDTEPVARHGVRQGNSKMGPTVWQCIDRKACQLY
jgi:hypothetical protein